MKKHLHIEELMLFYMQFIRQALSSFILWCFNDSLLSDTDITLLWKPSSHSCHMTKYWDGFQSTNTFQSLVSSAFCSIPASYVLTRVSKTYNAWSPQHCTEQQSKLAGQLKCIESLSHLLQMDWFLYITFQLCLSIIQHASLNNSQQHILYA